MLECALYTPSIFFTVIGLTTLGLVVYLARYGTRSSTVTWLRTFMTFSALLDISDAVMRCSQTSTEFHITVALYVFSVALLMPLLFIFTVHFVNKAQLLNNLWLRLLLIATESGILYIFWQTNLFVNHSFADASLSFNNHLPGTGNLSQIIGLAVFIVYFIPIVMTIRYQSQLRDPVKKKEVRVVTLALIILIVPSVIVEGILPVLFHVPDFPLSPFMGLTAALMITYAITHYGLHIFSLNNATDNIIQIMPGGLIILDHTNTIQYINDGASNMLGYKAEHLIGASAKELFQKPENYNDFQTKVLAVLGPSQQIAGQEIIFTTKHKTSLTASINAVNVYTNEELINCFISFTDITPLKQAEAALTAEKATVERKVIERTKELNKAQSQLKASIRSLPFGFAIIDQNQQILFANELLGKLMNRDLSDDLGYSNDVLEQINQEYKPTIDILHCIDESQRKKHTLNRNITLGSCFYRFLFAPIVDRSKEEHNVLGTILIMEDVTEAKTIERSKDEFFSIASHELRTPLSAIRGNTSMMLRFYKEQLKDPILHTMVDDVYTASLRLITIVNDFLDVSRLEMKKFLFDNKPINIAEVIRTTLREYEVTGSRKKLTLKFEAFPGDDPWVKADPDRTRQILINLIGNALKATKAGGITITLEPHEHHMAINVTDTGMGIPLESQHLLFRKFQQASNNILIRDNTQSTGLGLYISKLLAEGLNGKLYLNHSQVGKGTTFTLELPITTPTIKSLTKEANNP